DLVGRQPRDLDDHLVAATQHQRRRHLHLQPFRISIEAQRVFAGVQRDLLLGLAVEDRDQLAVFFHHDFHVGIVGYDDDVATIGGHAINNGGGNQDRQERSSKSPAPSAAGRRGGDVPPGRRGGQRPRPV